MKITLKNAKAEIEHHIDGFPPSVFVKTGNVCYRFTAELTEKDANTLVKNLNAKNGSLLLNSDYWTEHHDNFIDVYLPIAGWKARHMFWDKEMGFFDCWNTSFCAYKTREEAVAYAKTWAEDEEIFCAAKEEEDEG